MWPKSVQEKALVACGRKCCICHRFCGTKIELHHIVQDADAGASDFENCIPLCFDCHADVGHYNPRHPKGKRYSATELRGHRDQWYKLINQLRVDEAATKNSIPGQLLEVYEGQEIVLRGYVWRETFPGRPNYESFETDEKETYWMFILKQPISLFFCSPEHEDTLRIDNITKLQLMVNPDFYAKNSAIVLTDVNVSGKLHPSYSGHHHGQALFEVIRLV
jgi:HNH endonuclease